jgi:hypothetical protein
MYDNEDDEVTYVGQEAHDDAIRFLASFGDGKPSAELYACALGDDRTAIVGDVDLERKLERNAALHELARYDLAADADADDYLAAYERAAADCGVDLRRVS